MVFLPDELLRHIISYLDDTDLESLSLVSKQFLSITNSLNQTLKLSHKSAPFLLQLADFPIRFPFLPSLLRRFSSIKRLSLIDFQTPDPVLLQLADFPIRLQTLNLSGLIRLPLKALHRLPASVLSGVKCLDISRIPKLCDDDLDTIPVLFPALEELDLSNPITHEGNRTFGYGKGRITNNGIQLLIPKLNACLRKINLSGHPYLSTCKSLILLSQNCPNLEEIVVNGSCYMNQIGIVVSSFKKLRSIVFRGSSSRDEYQDLHLPLHLCWDIPSLSKIEFESVFVSGYMLRVIAEASLPLKSFTLANTSGYSFDDVLSFMNTYDSLDYLEIKGTLYRDRDMATLAQHLTNAKVVKLTGCPNLSLLTLFTYILHCPLLHTFEMNCDDKLGAKYYEVVGGYRFTSHIRNLKVSRSCRLTDKDLSRIALVCPSLERLELEKCQGISNDGLEEIMGKCPNLKHLIIDGCYKVNNGFQNSET